MAKKSPSIPSRVLDTLGIGSVIRETRDKATRTLGIAALIGLVAHGGGKGAELIYQGMTGYNPDAKLVQVAEKTNFAEGLIEAGEAQKDRIETEEARRSEGWLKKTIREGAEGIGNLAKEILPIEEAAKDFKEGATEVGRAIDDSSKWADQKVDKGTEALNDLSYYLGFIGAMLAQLALLRKLSERKKKKLEENNKESIKDLEHEKKLKQFEIDNLKLQAELVKAKLQLETNKTASPQMLSHLMSMSEQVQAQSNESLLNEEAQGESGANL